METEERGAEANVVTGVMGVCEDTQVICYITWVKGCSEQGGCFQTK